MFIMNQVFYIKKLVFSKMNVKAGVREYLNEFNEF